MNGLARIVAGAAFLASAVPARADHVIATGHIAATGSYTSIRSVTVLTGQSGTDGFFFRPTPEDTVLTTHTTDRSGRGYNLSFNFFERDDPPWWDDGVNPWLGQCATGRVDEVCIVPERATYAEVTGARGIDLEVTVVQCHEDECGTPTAVTRS